MTEDKKRELKRRMDALHEKYCQQLPDKYQEIEDCWNNYQTDLTNPTFIETFYRLIHTFKGTAATFGFTIQSDLCFGVQKILIPAKENHTVLKESDVKKIQAYLDGLKINLNSPAENISD